MSLIERISEDLRNAETILAAVVVDQRLDPELARDVAGARDRLRVGRERLEQARDRLDLATRVVTSPYDFARRIRRELEALWRPYPHEEVP